MIKNKNSPPLSARFLLSLFARFSNEYSLLGDMDEEYYDLANLKCASFAKRWYWRSFAKILPQLIFQSMIWRISMFRNYYKIAIRNLYKNLSSSFINIFGLTIGMACTIFIFLWIQDEYNYDSFHSNSNELVRIVQNQVYSDGTDYQVAVTPDEIGPALVKDYPEIVNCSRFRPYSKSLISTGDKKFYETGLCFADPSFFTMFSWQFIDGTPKEALSNPHSIVITEKIASKYFPNESAIGKTMTLNNSSEFIVTGVIKNVPANSHLQFELAGNFERMVTEFGWNNGWFNNNFYTYAQLQPGTDINIINEKVKYYIKKIDEESTTEFSLQPLRDIHLKSDYSIDLTGHSENGEIYITFFSIIAIFVLSIACINFMNLTTAQSTKRLKEIGVRKVNGALRRDIAAQFFSEALLAAFLASLLSNILVVLLLPSFNSLTGKSFEINVLISSNVTIIIFLIAIITGILSGIYPAIYLSSFHPIKVLKGIKSGSSSKSYLRRILIVTQFSLSLILIIGTLVVFSQLEYMQNSNLGYEKEHIVYFRKNAGITDNYDAFKTELKKDPNILNVTTSNSLMSYTVNSFGGLKWEGKDPEDMVLIYRKSADYDFINTFGMEIIEGRDFSKDITTDAGSAFIVNEEAVKLMNMKKPIGKWIKFFGKYEGSIIGVVKNFHYKSLHEKIEPLLVMINPEWDRYVFVKVNSKNISESLASIEKVHNTFNKEYPFEFTFLDDDVNTLYETEVRTKNIFQIFTSLGIFISSVGLLGLITFAAEQRVKEIGIRKVLGSSISGIVALLTKEFLILVTISNIIAWPLAFYFMKSWLEGFAYHVSINVSLFFIAGIATTTLTFLTIFWKTFNAARANPVNSLKYE
ncbi:MAG: ABC transporter permease [Bacteroidetes bacterium]|nr:ABC transporter permease [Bacteroidota bacterium]